MIVVTLQLASLMLWLVHGSGMYILVFILHYCNVICEHDGEIRRVYEEEFKWSYLVCCASEHRTK